MLVDTKEGKKSYMFVSSLVNQLLPETVTSYVIPAWPQLSIITVRSYGGSD